MSCSICLSVSEPTLLSMAFDLTTQFLATDNLMKPLRLWVDVVTPHAYLNYTAPFVHPATIGSLLCEALVGFFFRHPCEWGDWVLHLFLTVLILLCIYLCFCFPKWTVITFKARLCHIYYKCRSSPNLNKYFLNE